MRRLRSAALLVFVVLTVGRAHAQSSTLLTTTPSPAPAGVAFTVQAETGGCTGASAVVVNGFTIDVTVEVLQVSAPCLLGFKVGPLLPGTYVVLFHDAAGHVVFPPGTLIVPPPVPAIEPRMLALLAVVLIVIAGLALKAHA